MGQFLGVRAGALGLGLGGLRFGGGIRLGGGFSLGGGFRFGGGPGGRLGFVGGLSFGGGFSLAGGFRGLIGGGCRRGDVQDLSGPKFPATAGVASPVPANALPVHPLPNAHFPAVGGRHDHDTTQPEATEAQIGERTRPEA